MGWRAHPEVLVRQESHEPSAVIPARRQWHDGIVSQHLMLLTDVTLIPDSWSCHTTAESKVILVTSQSWRFPSTSFSDWKNQNDSVNTIVEIFENLSWVSKLRKWHTRTWLTKNDRRKKKCVGELGDPRDTGRRVESSVVLLLVSPKRTLRKKLSHSLSTNI
jgi:hypothetical protein